MQRAMIRWKIKPEHLDEELVLLAETYSEMQQLRPAGLRYDTYQLDDRMSFIAVAEMENGLGVLAQLPAFQRYRGTLDARCEIPPVVTVLDDVGLLYPSR